MRTSLPDVPEPMTSFFTRHQTKIQLIGMIIASAIMLYFGLLLYITSQDSKIYNATLQKFVQQHINGQINIENINWKLFPTLGLTLESVELQSFMNTPLVKGTNVTLSTAFWPLLQGNIQIKTVQIGTLNTFITLDQEGTSNWNNIIKKQNKDSHQLNHLIQSIQAENFEIQNTQLHISTPHHQYSATGPSIQVTRLKLNNNASLKIFGDTLIEKNNGRIALGTIQLESKFKITEQSFKVLTFNSISTWPNQETKPMKVEITGASTYKFKTDILSINPLNIIINDAELISEISIEKLTDAPETIITLPQQTPKLGRFAKPIIGSSLGMAHVIDLIDSLEIGGHFIFSGDKIGVFLNTFKIDAHPGSINMTYDIKKQKWESEIHLAYIDLRPILAPPKSAKIKGNNIALIDTLKARDIQLPIQYLRRLTLQSKIKIGQFIHTHFTLKNLNITTDADQGILTFSPVKAQIFKGQASLDATLDVRENTAKLTLLQTSEQLDINDLLNNTTQHSWLIGFFDHKLNLASTGLSIGDLTDNATGTLDIKLKRGAIPNTNFQHIAYNSIDLLKGTLHASARASFEKHTATTSQGTSIDNFFASLAISKKDISSSEVLAQLNKENTIGSIHFNRATKKLQYTTHINIPSIHPLLNQLQWPVSCIIEDWNLPLCGVSEIDLLHNLQQQKNKQHNSQQHFIHNKDTILNTNILDTKSIHEAVNQTFK